jgi:hypothetical protein
VQLMRCITHLSTLTDLDFRDNTLSADDCASVVYHAAAAGMTSLQKLLLFESRSLSPNFGISEVVSCAQWQQLKLSPPPHSIRHIHTRGSVKDVHEWNSLELLQYVMHDLVAQHCLSVLACSRSLTFRAQLNCSPCVALPLLVSNPQRLRLLASGGLLLLLLRLTDAAAARVAFRYCAGFGEAITRRVKGAAAASFALHGCCSGANWPVIWPPRMLLPQD